MNPLINNLNSKLAITIRQVDLFDQAMQHTSFVNEHRRRKLASNERLEFLGDAVLEIIVSEFLYQQYPNLAEGELSRMRAQLVREPSLARLARQLNLPDYLKLGRGELKSGGLERDSILSDALEALLGALYLDQGLEVVRDFLHQELLKDHVNWLKLINKDYKTLLQERLQQQGTVLIEYRELAKSGPAHHQQFTMGLYINQELVAEGTGLSKKKAEMAAAQAALAKLD